MPRFRTVRISDPRFEHGHLRHMTIKSSHLNGRGDICLFIPPDTQSKDLPIVTLLHGVYGSAHSWSSCAGVHLTANRMIEEKTIRPMILAMPSDGLWGDGSGYLKHKSADYEKWICEDVIDAVKLNIKEAEHSKQNFIAGLSMGGFGALRIGAKNPKIYDAISGLSSITTLEQMGLFVEEDLNAFKQEDEADEDVFQTILANEKNLQPLRFDCGKDDILIEHNRKLHHQLNLSGITHYYKENDGKHEWTYWEENVAETLLFFNEYIIQS